MSTSFPRLPRVADVRRARREIVRPSRLESPAIRCSRALTVAARARMSCGSVLGALGANSGGSPADCLGTTGLIFGLVRARQCRSRRLRIRGRPGGTAANTLARPAGAALPRIDHVRKAAESSQRLVGSRDELASQPRDVPPARQPPSAQLRTINLHDQRAERKAESDHSRHERALESYEHIVLSSLVMSREQPEFATPACNNCLCCRSCLTGDIPPRPACGLSPHGRPVRSHSLRVAPCSPLLRVRHEGLNLSLEKLPSTVGVSYPISTEPLPESRK